MVTFWAALFLALVAVAILLLNREKAAVREDATYWERTAMEARRGEAMAVRDYDELTRTHRGLTAEIIILRHAIRAAEGALLWREAQQVAQGMESFTAFMEEHYGKRAE